MIFATSKKFKTLAEGREHIAALQRDVKAALSVAEGDKAKLAAMPEPKNLAQVADQQEALLKALGRDKPAPAPAASSQPAPTAPAITKMRRELKVSFDSHETKSLTGAERDQIRMLIATHISADSPAAARASTAASIDGWLAKLRTLPEI